MLTDVAACKAFRGIQGDNQEHDEELDRLVKAVQEFLERECERKFEQAEVMEFYNGDDWHDRLIVARPPIVSILNIWDDPARLYATPIPATSYVIDHAEAGVIRLDQLCFLPGLRNIKITYTGGFAQTPKDLEEAAIEMVWAAREKGASNLVGVRSRSVADGSVQYVNLGWPLDLDSIVGKYRLHVGVA